MYDKECTVIIQKLINKKNLSEANWLIVKCMIYKQYVSYAVFSAEQFIDIFEKNYPNDDRPRKAIEAAKKCIKDPSKKNKEAAAVYAAYAADYVIDYAAYADAADYVIDYAAYADAAVYATSAAASSAAYAANYAAADAANAAANASVYASATAAAKKEMQLKILNYGVSLLKQG